MKIIYIKFRHKDDIYAINPAYNLKPGGESAPPITCGACGDTLYVPVELSEDTTISIPLPDLYKPVPKEMPHLVIKQEPQLPTLAAFRNIPDPEQQRLRLCPGMAFVDGNGFEMLIAGASNQPIEHKCGS